MKKFQDITKNSSIICAYIDADVPTPEYSYVVEAVKLAEEQYNIPSRIFVRSKDGFDTSDWFAKIFEGISFVETDYDNLLDVVEEQRSLYHNVVVVDSNNNSSLHEGVDTVYYESATLTTRARVYVDNKNFSGFSRLYEGFLTEAEARRLYTTLNPPTRYADLKTSIDETREQFYQGTIMPVGGYVTDDKGTYEILDRGSNYLVVVNEDGETFKKFPSVLTDSKVGPNYPANSFFKGFVPSVEFMQNEEVVESFSKTIALFEEGSLTDGFAILKAAKLLDKVLTSESTDLGQIQYSLSRINQLDEHTYLNEMIDKSVATQLQAAKIIAGAIGSSTKGTPTEIVNAAIKTAKASSNKNQLSILSRMLDTASKVGLVYDRKLMESMDDSMVRLHRDHKLLKEKPTSEVLSAHQEMRKLGVDYSAKDVGGKRAMVKDILAHSHGPRTLSSYKALTANIRKSMDEEVEINKILVPIEKKDEHTKPGFSLSANDLVRKMKVRKLQDN